MDCRFVHSVYIINYGIKIINRIGLSRLKKFTCISIYYKNKPAIGTYVAISKSIRNDPEKTIIHIDIWRKK